VTAARELQEEVGYRAGRLEFVGELRPFSKYLTTRSFVYLARDLVPSAIADRDENYEIGVERVPLARFEVEVAAGRLVDARVVAALFLARALIEQRRP
jgi:8-oxo-dGTP pyrophosphatase MutT (NUDIX family)